MRFISSALFAPDQPRQALGAAEARDDPEVDLRLAEERRLRAAIRTSQPIASSQPPPNAIALTAAIVATPARSIVAQQRVGAVEQLAPARSRRST